MRLIIEEESIKIQNFVEYLIENYKEKGKTYEFEIHLDDKYDRKLIEKRESSLKDKILLLHNDGFEILGSEFLADVVLFKNRISQLIDDESIIKDFNAENFNNQFIHYKISFIENDQKHQFDFSFINLSK